MKKLKECYNLYINTNIDKDVLKSVNDDIIKYTTEIEDILNENENELMYCGYPVPDRKLVNKPTFYLHINTFGGSEYTTSSGNCQKIIKSSPIVVAISCLWVFLLSLLQQNVILTLIPHL